MNLYIPLALYIILVSIIFKKKKSFLFLMTFTPLLLFFGTRVDMGVDYIDYVYKYNQSHTWGWTQFVLDATGGKFEPGFFLLMKLAPSFDALIFLCTFLGMAPVALFFYKFIPNKYYPLAFLLYLFNFRIFESFIAMRSGVVVGLFMMAIILKYYNHKIFAIIVSFFSGFFHMSGFFLVPVMFLSDKFLRKNYKVVTVFVLSLMVTALLLPSIYGDLFINLSSPIQELEVYRQYVTGTGYGLGFYIFSIFRFCFAIYILSLIKRGFVDDNHLWIAWMTILGYFIFMVQGIEVMYRFVYYFYLISIPFKCYVLKIDKTVFSKMYVGLSVVYLLYTFIEYTQLDHVLQYISKYNSFLF